MTPVTTIMVGRTDDWIQVVTKRDGIIVSPQYLPWAGVAVFKKAVGIYEERGFRSRLLAAAYRHHLHWSELIGGDIVLTIPSKWQKLFNGSAVEVKERINDPVSPEIIEELYERVPDFRKAYDEDGMTVDEFDTFGATVRTLRGFIASHQRVDQDHPRRLHAPQPGCEVATVVGSPAIAIAIAIAVGRRAGADDRIGGTGKPRAGPVPASDPRSPDRSGIGRRQPLPSFPHPDHGGPGPAGEDRFRKPRRERPTPRR